MGPLLEAFLRWLDKNHTRFRHAPRLLRRTDTSCVLMFEGIHEAVSGHVSESEIGIAVDYRGETWDFLIYFDVAAEEVDGDIICRLCDSEHRKKFLSYDELFADHCFEPLLKWCNDNFSGDAQLRLYSSKSGGTTWAMVVSPASAPDPYVDGCVAWWPLRV